MARPTKLTKKVRDEICTRIAGGESLRSVCDDTHLPVMSSVLLWVVDNRDGFSEHYMRAREAAGFAHADRLVHTVDKVADGTYDPQTAKAMLDGLKWAAERMAPKRHSPRQELVGDGGGPIQMTVSPDDEQL